MVGSIVVMVPVPKAPAVLARMIAPLTVIAAVSPEVPSKISKPSLLPPSPATIPWTDGSSVPLTVSVPPPVLPSSSKLVVPVSALPRSSVRLCPVATAMA